MQTTTLDVLWILIAGCLTLLLFASAYVFLTARSNTRIRSAESSKLEEVTRSEQKYRGLFENSLAGILRFSLNGWKVLDSNQALRSMFLCSTNAELESLVGEVSPVVRQEVEQTLIRDHFMDQYELQLPRKDGRTIWVLGSARTIDGGKTVEAVLLDISLRKQFEEKIREQSALLDQAEDAFIVINLSGEIKYWNSGGELTYGWTSEEAIGKSIADLLFDQPDVAAFRSAIADVRRFNEWRGEQTHRRKDGNKILVEGRWRTIETSIDGVQYVLVVGMDVTEKRKIEARIARAQRTETIAVLTGGLAHDLQNVLAPVRMSARLLRKRIPDESNRRLVTAIVERATTGLQLLRNVLMYGKGTVVLKRKQDIKRLLQEVVSNVKRNSPKGIAYLLETSGQKWKILGDAGQLKQAFTNLLLNARDAVSRDGVVKVEAHDVVLDDSYVASYQGAEGGPFVVVEVSDSGWGIPQGDLERIFEPFYTTKERKGGTGLGLSIVHGIVAGHKGFVSVSSVVGKGTTFRVFLPAFVSKRGMRKEIRQ